ncbi:MAG: hypothetical protein VX267_01290 [Candidatus Thermoplasmatota archaeon]|nr:hypothetical protein [Candidatus Thermoplasmatota archaeon]
MGVPPVEWLQAQLDDPAGRERLFKLLAVISQGMLLLGVLLVLWMLRGNLSALTGN